MGVFNTADELTSSAVQAMTGTTTTAMRTMTALLPMPAVPDALRAALGYTGDGGSSSGSPANARLQQAQQSQQAQPRDVEILSFDASSFEALLYSSSTSPPRRITSIAAAAEQRNATVAIAQYASPISYQHAYELPASLVRRWAGRWGYEYWLQTAPFRANARGPGAVWQKLPLIVQLCRAGYPRVVFVDYDAFVLREDMRIEPFFDGEGLRGPEVPTPDITFGALNAPFFTALGYKRATEERPQLNAGVILVQSSAWAISFFERMMRDGSCRTHVMNAEEICLNNAAERETEPDRFAFVPYGRLQCDPVMGKLIGWTHELNFNEQQDRCETPLFYHAMGTDIQKRGGSEVAAAVATRLAAGPQMAPYASVGGVVSDVCAAQPLHAASPNASLSDADQQLVCHFCSLLGHPHRCPGGERWPSLATARAIPGLASVIPSALSKQLSSLVSSEDELTVRDATGAKDSGVAGAGAGSGDGAKQTGPAGLICEPFEPTWSASEAKGAQELIEVFGRRLDEAGLDHAFSDGTLLGALRYGTFLPWDDDVDVMMPSEAASARARALFEGDPTYCTRSSRPLIYATTDGWRFSRCAAPHYPFIDVIAPTTRAALNWADALLQSNGNVGNWSSRADLAEVDERLVFPSQRMTFASGSTQIRVPRQPEAWLRHNYGDYWRTECVSPSIRHVSPANGQNASWFKWAMGHFVGNNYAAKTPITVDCAVLARQCGHLQLPQDSAE